MNQPHHQTKLMVKDTPEAAAQEVIVRIPVLGAYRKTWPLNCPKSDKIVRGFADYLAKPDSYKGRHPVCPAVGSLPPILAKGASPVVQPAFCASKSGESQFGGHSHVGTYDGFEVFINGRQLVEVKGPEGRNSGGEPDGAYITSDFFNDFKGGKVVVAAKAFLGHRGKDEIKGNMNIWFQRMKMPPVGDDLVRKSATIIPMLSSAWQEKLDPNNKELQTDHDKFRYDGKFTANPKVTGSWTTVAVVPAIETFDPAKPADANRAPLKTITLKDEGLTDSGTLIWSGDTLLDLDRFQALKMTPRTIGASAYLFIEAGGFSDQNPPGWKSPLIVMKKK